MSSEATADGMAGTAPSHAILSDDGEEDDTFDVIEDDFCNQLKPVTSTNLPADTADEYEQKTQQQQAQMAADWDGDDGVAGVAAAVVAAAAAATTSGKTKKSGKHGLETELAENFMDRLLLGLSQQPDLELFRDDADVEDDEEDIYADVYKDIYPEQVAAAAEANKKNKLHASKCLPDQLWDLLTNKIALDYSHLEGKPDSAKAADPTYQWGRGLSTVGRLLPHLPAFSIHNSAVQSLTFLQQQQELAENEQDPTGDAKDASYVLFKTTCILLCCAALQAIPSTMEHHLPTTSTVGGKATKNTNTGKDFKARFKRWQSLAFETLRLFQRHCCGHGHLEEHTDEESHQHHVKSVADVYVPLFHKHIVPSIWTIQQALLNHNSINLSMRNMLNDADITNMPADANVEEDARFIHQNVKPAGFKDDPAEFDDNASQASAMTATTLPQMSPYNRHFAVAILSGQVATITRLARMVAQVPEDDDETIAKKLVKLPEGAELLPRPMQQLLTCLDTILFRNGLHWDDTTTLVWNHPWRELLLSSNTFLALAAKRKKHKALLLRDDEETLLAFYSLDIPNNAPAANPNAPDWRDDIAYMDTAWDSIGIAILAARGLLEAAKSKTLDSPNPDQVTTSLTASRALVYAPAHIWRVWFPHVSALIRHNRPDLADHLLEYLLRSAGDGSLTLSSKNQPDYPVATFELISSRMLSSGQVDNAKTYQSMKDLLAKFKPADQVTLVEELVTSCPHQSLKPKLLDLLRSAVNWKDDTAAQQSACSFLESILSDLETQLGGSMSDADNSLLLTRREMYCSAISIMVLWLMMNKAAPPISNLRLRLQALQDSVRGLIETQTASDSKKRTSKVEGDAFCLNLLDSALQQALEQMAAL